MEQCTLIRMEEGRCSTGPCLFSSPHTLAWSLWSVLNLPLNLGCVTGKETVRDSDNRKFSPTFLSLRDLTQLNQTLDYATEKHLRTSRRNKVSMFRAKARGSAHFTFRLTRQMVSKSICTLRHGFGLSVEGST